MKQSILENPARAVLNEPALLPEHTDPPTSAPDAFEFSIVEGCDAVSQVWKMLERELNCDTISCSWAWTETWLRHYGDLVPHQFAIGRSGGVPRGICLLTRGAGQKEGPFRVRTMHLGTAGEPQLDSTCVEYNDVLVEPQHRDAFALHLLKHVFRDGRWDRFNLDGMAADAVAPFLSARSGFRLRQESSWYFDLKRARQGGTGVLPVLSSKVRANLRRNLRILGDLSQEWAQTPEQAESIFADLVQLHQQRWNSVGKPGAFASSRFLNFHRELIKRLFPDGKVVLFRVRHGAQALGCLYVFVENNRLLLYQSGRTLETGPLSPGLVTNYLFIEEALTRGFDAYDFMGGVAKYKEDLSTDCNQLVWAAWRRPRLKMLITDGLRSVRRALPASCRNGLTTLVRTGLRRKPKGACGN